MLRHYCPPSAVNMPAPSMPEFATQLAETRYLRALMDDLQQGICFLDERQGLRLWNPGFANLLAAPAGMLQIGQSWPDLLLELARLGRFGPGDPAALVRRLSPAASGNAPQAVQQTLLNGRGCLLQHRPVHDGAVHCGFLTTLIDMRENAPGKEREQLAQKVFLHSPLGIIVTDDRHRIASINPACIQLIGFEKVEFL